MRLRPLVLSLAVPALLAIGLSLPWPWGGGMARGQEARSGKPTLELPSGRMYVGQGIAGSVRVGAEHGPPRVTLPTSRDFRVEVVGSGPGSAGEGQYRVDARIFALRPGRLIFPPIRLEFDGRTEATAPTTLTILAPPQAGRPSTFLGGVGRIEPRAEAVPPSILLGDSFDLAITFDGPGAIGSTVPPVVDLDGARVRALAPKETADPPSRILRYQVRPDREGRLVVPPLRVSWLDPDSGRYMTTASNSLAVDVAAVSAFDSTDPEIVATPDSNSRGEPTPRVAIGAGGLAMAGACLALALLRKRSRSRSASPRHLADKAIRALSAIREDEEFGREAVAALAGFLLAVAKRPAGALTPEEARSWVAHLTNEPVLGARAAASVAECDRLAYGMRPHACPASDSRASMIALLRNLGRIAGTGKTERGTGDRDW